ncbi:MAG: AsmA family protein [Oligoflexia bacterium]|nr:AsmA family protein [Oligoflexia bacterium]
MKKLLWLALGVFVFICVVAISIPFFVNVDRYRSALEAEVNSRINGQVVLGKLSLHLWGSIKIHADSINLKINGYEQPAIETKEFYINLPIGSLLTGKPRVVVVLDKPNLRIEKDKDGKLNLLQLKKNSEEKTSLLDEKVSDEVEIHSLEEKEKKYQDELLVISSSEEKKEEQKAQPVTQLASGEKSETKKIPAILSGASIDLRIQSGDLQYFESEKLIGKVNGLEVSVQNLGLASPMDVRLVAPFDFKTEAYQVSGPIEVLGNMQPRLQGGTLSLVYASTNIDLTKVEIVAQKDRVHKGKGVPLSLKIQLEGNENETFIKDLDLSFADLVLNGKGRIKNSPLSAKLEVVAEPFSLHNLQSTFKDVAAYDLKGQMRFTANVDVYENSFRLNGDLKISDGSFFAKEFFQNPIKFQSQIGFSENSLNIIRMGVNAPETDVELSGKFSSFLAPRFSFTIRGKQINLDKLLKEPQKTAGFSFIPAAYAAKESPQEGPLKDLRKNSAFLKAQGTVFTQINHVIIKKTDLKDVKCRVALNKAKLDVQEASLETYEGKLNAKAELDLLDPRLTFASSGSIEGVNAGLALANYFPKYKNTLEGKGGGSWSVQGKAFPEALRMKSFTGSAKVQMQEGAIKSIDFQDSINSTMKKVPFLKNKKPLEIDDGFSSLTASISFSNGITSVNPVEIQPRKRGFVVKGKSIIQESMEQESFFDIYDPQKRLPEEIQKAGKPAIEVRLYGSLQDPKTDFEYTVSRLAKNAGSNLVKKEGAKLLDKVIGGGDSQGGGDKLKDLGDKLKKKFKIF